MNDSPHNFLQKRPGCCSCCGVVVLAPGEDGQLQDVGYRRLHFELSDKTVTFATFCPECVSHEWDKQRLQLFEDQCQRGWRQYGYNPYKSGWNPDTLTVRSVSRSYPVQTWSEVQ